MKEYYFWERVDTRPPLWARIYMRLRFGKDSYCDNCGQRTWWNGNKAVCDTTICDDCHASFMDNTENDNV